MRNGDFSDYRDINGNLITIYDPATGRNVNGQWVRDPFPGNIIPADRINPVAGQLLQYWPTPNNRDPAVPAWQNNLAYAEHFNKDEFWNWVGKVDHNFSPNDRVFGRWGRNERNELRNTTAIRSGPSQDGQLPLIRTNDALVADWVHVFDAGAVLNVRGGYSEFLELSRSDEGLGFDPSSLGLPSDLASQLPTENFPRIRVVCVSREQRVYRRQLCEPVARVEPGDEQGLFVAAQRVVRQGEAQSSRRPRPPVHGCGASQPRPGRGAAGVRPHLHTA